MLHRQRPRPHHLSTYIFSENYTLGRFHRLLNSVITLIVTEPFSPEIGLRCSALHLFSTRGARLPRVGTERQGAFSRTKRPSPMSPSFGAVTKSASAVNAAARPDPFTAGRSRPPLSASRRRGCLSSRVFVGPALGGDEGPEADGPED